MRQSLTLLLASSAAAFAPATTPRAAIALRSSVKPTAGISFYDGLYEPDVPDVKLTRWRCSVRTRGLRSDRVVPDRGVTRRKRGQDDAVAVSPPSTPSTRRRSKDGENGVATFNFDKPSFFNCEREEDVPQGAITAMTMEDEEGEISTANVSARFVEGKPVGLLVRHEMKSPGEWDRFMRFMERYAEANGLGFAKA